MTSDREPGDDAPAIEVKTEATDESPDRNGATLGAPDRTAALLVATIAGIVAVASVLVKLFDLIEITVMGFAATLVVALVSALAAPTLVVRKFDKDYGPLRTSQVRYAAWLGAAFLVLAVGVPLVWTYADAIRAEETGLAEHRSQRYATAVADLERAISRYEAIGLTGRARPVQVALAESYVALGDRQKAESIIDELESKALSDTQRGVLFAARANIAASFGEFERSDRLYQQALSALDPTDREYAIVLHNQASLLLDRGSIRRTEAIANLSEAQLIHEAIGDELGLAYVLATRSRAESSIAGQRPRLLEALSLATSAGDELLIATLKENLALTHQAERQFDEATALHEDALRLFQTLADATGQANVYANLASLHAQMGHTALSKQHATQSAAILRTIDLDGNDAPPDALARLWGLQAVIFEQQGDTDSAAEAYETSLSILDLHPYPMTRAEVLVNYGGFKLASGDTIDAERILNEAEGLVTRFLAGTNSRVEATLEAVMARVAAVRGDLDAAATHYQNAIAIFAEYGDDGASARQMLSLAELITEPGAFVEFIAAAKTLAEATGPLSADFEANALLLQYQSIATDDDKPALATRLLELAGDTSVPWPIQVDILVTIQTDHLEITGRLGPVTSRLSDLHEDDSLSPVQELRVNRQLARIAAASGDPRDAVEFARRSLELVDAAEGFERVDIRIEAGRILTQSGEIDEGFDAMFTGFLDGQSSGLFDFDADDVATQSAGEAELSGAIREVVLAHVNEVAAIEVLLARVELITSRPLGLIAESNFGDIAWELETLRWHRDNPDE